MKLSNLLYFYFLYPDTFHCDTQSRVGAGEKFSYKFSYRTNMLRGNVTKVGFYLTKMTKIPDSDLWFYF